MKTQYLSIIGVLFFSLLMTSCELHDVANVEVEYVDILIDTTYEKGYYYENGHRYYSEIELNDHFISASFQNVGFEDAYDVMVDIELYTYWGDVITRRIKLDYIEAGGAVFYDFEIMLEDDEIVDYETHISWM